RGCQLRPQRASARLGQRRSGVRGALFGPDDFFGQVLTVRSTLITNSRAGSRASTSGHESLVCNRTVTTSSWARCAHYEDYWAASAITVRAILKVAVCSVTIASKDLSACRECFEI